MANKEVKKPKTRKITLGDTANYFHDSFTGITIAKGEVKEVEERQLRTKRIRNAISSGHLAYPNPDADEEVLTDSEKLEALVEKIRTASVSGKDIKKTAAMFTMPELEAIAKHFELEPEETDTKETLVEAIFGKAK